MADKKPSLKGAVAATKAASAFGEKKPAAKKEAAEEEKKPAAKKEGAAKEEEPAEGAASKKAAPADKAAAVEGAAAPKKAAAPKDGAAKDAAPPASAASSSSSNPAPPTPPQPSEVPKPPPDRLCMSHPLNPISLYCENCESACCIECKSTGNHSGQFHSVVPLTEGFRTKLVLLHSYMNGALLAKRDALLNQLKKSDIRLTEVRGAKQSIEQETRAEMEAILQRLQVTEATKTATLQRDVSDMKRDLEDIGRFTKKIAEMGASPLQNDMCEFLSRFMEHRGECESLVMRPMREVADVRADDFEREIQQRREASDSFGQMQQIVNVKNAMIAALLEDRQEMMTRHKQEMERMEQLYEEARYELSEWMRLNDKYLEKMRTGNGQSGGAPMPGSGSSPTPYPNHGYYQPHPGAAVSSSGGFPGYPGYLN